MLLSTVFRQVSTFFPLLFFFQSPHVFLISMRLQHFFLFFLLFPNLYLLLNLQDFFAVQLYFLPHLNQIYFPLFIFCFHLFILCFQFLYLQFYYVTFLFKLLLIFQSTDFLIELPDFHLLLMCCIYCLFVTSYFQSPSSDLIFFFFDELAGHNI